ncbi:Chromo domain containing protein [Pseudohyphozyma bogoriensis]|nr:Chromo domain containing protein [Pseudohyphozyma bogoriensis]
MVSLARSPSPVLESAPFRPAVVEPNSSGSASSSSSSSSSESGDDGDDDGDDDGEPEYVVQAILKHRRDAGHGMEYLVKWEGYDAKGDNTWEPEENLAHTDLLARYKQKHGIGAPRSKSSSSNAVASGSGSRGASGGASTGSARPPKRTILDSESSEEEASLSIRELDAKKDAVKKQRRADELAARDASKSLLNGARKQFSSQNNEKGKERATERDEPPRKKPSSQQSSNAGPSNLQAPEIVAPPATTPPLPTSSFTPKSIRARRQEQAAKPFSFLNRRAVPAPRPFQTTRDPRKSRTPSTGPEAQATAMSVGSPAETDGEALGEAVPAITLADLERRFQATRLYDRHRDLFEKHHKALAYCLILNFPCNLAARLKGKCCAVPQGEVVPAHSQALREANDAEGLALGVLLMLLDSRSPQTVQEVDVVFVHRQHAVFDVLAGAMIELTTRRSPPVEFFEFGSSGKVPTAPGPKVLPRVVPVLSYGYVVIPSLSAFRQNAELDRFLTLRERGKAIRIVVHPATISLARGDFQYKTTYETLERRLREPLAGQELKILPPTELPPTSLMAHLDRSALLSSAPLPAVTLESEFEEIQRALIHLRAALPKEGRRFLIIAEKGAPQLKEQCETLGLEYLTWAEASAALSASVF